MVYEGCPRFAHPQAWLHIRFLCCRFERLTGEAQKEILRSHVRQERIGADRLTGDARDGAAVRRGAPARQYVNQGKAGRNPDRVHVERQPTVFCKQAGGMTFESAPLAPESIRTLRPA